MKRIFLLLLLSQMVSLDIYAQYQHLWDDVIKETHQIWNADKQSWEDEDIISRTYDRDGRVTSILHKSQMNTDSLAQWKSLWEYVYNESGKLVREQFTKTSISFPFGSEPVPREVGKRKIYQFDKYGKIQKDETWGKKYYDADLIPEEKNVYGIDAILYKII